MKLIEPDTRVYRVLGQIHEQIWSAASCQVSVEVSRQILDRTWKQIDDRAPEQIWDLIYHEVSERTS